MLCSMASADVSRCQTPASGHKELMYTRNQGSNYTGYVIVYDGRITYKLLNIIILVHGF